MKEYNRTVRTAHNFGDEVYWGVSKEVSVLKRWADNAPSAFNARGFVKSGPMDDFDFVIFSKTGLVLCYLEIKCRRTPFKTFGDAIFPLRKHEFAVNAAQEQNIPVLAITQYGDGTLVEVNLATEPAKRAKIERRDRPGDAVDHVFYAKEQLTVLIEAGDGLS